ncbi:molybdopterin-synthase adenylyltransferase MoeB [Marisediminicola sp. LYQ85]|uniref:molybdopterin-synthase adenylyltransferase MoeB n=1 Tax=Marisediminicola sp. LYQ85 TaxID=3391062 RepID=UPI0039830CB2
MLGRDALERSSRTIALPGIGIDGQSRLAAARVLVIGAGGLGSPVLHYLAAAGVGAIGIVDFDTVDLSNLQRQVIHRTASVGDLKTASAARSIGELNPLVAVETHDVRLTRENALELVRDYDLVIDGSDNFATRYLANDAAAIARVPYVWGSVYRFDGQVTVFWEGAPDGLSIDYRDLHPTPPDPGLVLSCDEAGVLGAVCGTIGSMMAVEAIKLITGTGDVLLGRVQIFDALEARWRELGVRRHPDREPVTELIDYDAFCGVRAAGAGPTIEAGALRSALRDAGTVTLVDVREPYEHDLASIAGDSLVPLGSLVDDPSLIGDPSLTDGWPVVVYCQTGVRSGRAVEVLRAAGVEAVSLRGGIRAWLESDPVESDPVESEPVTVARA